MLNDGANAGSNANHAQTDSADSETLAEHMARVLDGLPQSGRLNLLDLLRAVGNDSLLLLTILLSLIFLVPVSVPGVSTVFGLGIVLIGLTRLLQARPWLPRRVAERQLEAQPLRHALQRALVWLQRLERIGRAHRWPWLSAPGLATFCNNLALVGAGLLLMAPFGLIPFSNTLPALAVLLFAVGMLQRDGLALLLGYAALLGTLLYFGFLLTVGVAGALELWRWLLGWLG